jgi:DNA invertase Pin-like site-specific DNA recombinase
MLTKIRPEHFSRTAVVYIRQSSLVQVYENQQSTERQYDLAARARQLGWSEGKVEVVDEDLGQSGSETTRRTGFQRLAGEVSLGRVGGIFALEVSRLARSSADWHKLLDLCALSNTVIADEDGIYDPNDFNDRLVLGMKGTMSDAERHVMRLRLLGGRLHKARKGTLEFCAPTGFAFDDEGALVVDPDDQVREALELVFKRFRLEGTAYAVVRYFRRHGLLFPLRRHHKDGRPEIVWLPLRASRITRILQNPAYAGAYVYGRSRERRMLIEGQVRNKRENLPRDQWSVLIRDAHPAYISWADYLKNIRQLEGNSFTRDRTARGAPKQGEALLQGLALCGRCGRRMQTRHHSTFSAYVCLRQGDGLGYCWSQVARHIDEKIVEIFLEAMAPPEIDLSLAVIREVERQTADLDRQWRLRLERARYEAQRAQRQFDAVEPENRVVARTLETRWNDKLRELEQAEREYEEARRTHRLQLTDRDKKTIISLARDLPRVWRASTTTPAERKQLLRMVIEDIVLAPVEGPEHETLIKILWKTGAVTEARAWRPTAVEAHRIPDDVADDIAELARSGMSDPEIATELNRRGIKNSWHGSFGRHSINDLRRRRDIPRGHEPGGGEKKLPATDSRGRFSIAGLAAKYNVTMYVVRYWLAKGLVTAEKVGPKHYHWIEVTPEIDAALAAAAARYRPRQKS